ncbi:MAG: alpha/beta hydrolase [Acidimicrobiia bacterium]|nr:alpha/beta hydrolase [Acidimicrobiia bacterium]
MTDTTSPNALAAQATTTTASTMERLAVGNEEIVVQSAGTGTPVGYLHGMIGTPPGAPILAAADAASLAVTAPCLPGFTGSSPSAITRNIHDWVFHLSAIIDATGLAGGPLVASSVGAMVALEVAAIRPDAFSQLILLSPLGLWDDEDPVVDAYATTLSAQRRLLTKNPAATGVFFDDPEGLEGDELVEYGVARYQTRTSAASLVWPIPDHNLTDRIHRVTTPVTLLWGDSDALAPISYLDRWAAALPNVTATHTVADAGHLIDWDQPAAVAEIVAGSLL